MAREMTSRFRLSGTLVARTPLHVGGYGADVDTDLPLARDGRGDLYVPGTSLTGALRQWCAGRFDETSVVDVFWGFQDGDQGHASHILVEDVPITAASAVVVEVRDGVGIDRERGAAAENIKYDRAILPRGTRLKFALSAEVCAGSNRLQLLALLAALQEALAGGRVRLGAAKTRGLGRVVLEDARLDEQTLNTRAGILAFLKQSAATIVSDLAAARRRYPPQSSPWLEVGIEWEPIGPLMVKAGFDGVAVDMLPLTSARDGGVSLVLPGSSVKGALRSQAERIVRTLLRLAPGTETGPRKKFLDDLDVKLVNDLFGLRKMNAADPGNGPLLGLSALAVDDCYGNLTLSRAHWQAVQAATNDLELSIALNNAGLVAWSEAYHVAVDRWTGAAAESMLYTVLEPHSASSMTTAVWEPLKLEIDLGRLRTAEQLPAVALLLVVLRDLAQGRLPLGFATLRGMGAVRVKKATITPHEMPAAPLDQVGGITVSSQGLAGVPAGLNAAWAAWIQEATS